MSQRCSTNPRQQKSLLGTGDIFSPLRYGPKLNQPMEDRDSVQLVVRFPGAVI